MNDLVLIPARGGSKRIPQKNIKHLNGRPLIYYTLDTACDIAKPEMICVSTDSDAIIAKVKEYGLGVPFKRPSNLAIDNAGTDKVILHAIAFYERSGVEIERVILLQPTSPFRTRSHVQEALAIYQDNLDMVVSVKETKANPYYTLFEENQEGFLFPSKKKDSLQRQNCPPVYEFNGAIYIINVASLKKCTYKQFSRIRKYVMPEVDSLDIDTHLDWIVAEAIIRLKKKERKV